MNEEQGEDDQQLLSGSRYVSKYRLYTHDKALRRTINKDYKNSESNIGCWKKFLLVIAIGALFQFLFISITVIQSALACISQTFQALLEKNPNKFECFHDSGDGNAPEGGEWRECTKEEICSQDIPQDRYRGDEDDGEYLDNWSQQYNLLCVEKWKIGLIGSMYYIGVISTVLIIPWWSDQIGRQQITLVSHYIFMGAILGILLAHDLIWLYFFVFISGSTFPGRAIVGMSWLLEYQKNSSRQFVLFFKLLSYPVLIIIFTLIFQFGTRHYVYVWIVILILSLIATIYQNFIIPESSNWLVEQQTDSQMVEARKHLTYVANLNEVYTIRDQPYDQFRFINEKRGDLKSDQFVSSSNEIESSEQKEEDQVLHDDMMSMIEYRRQVSEVRIAEERYTINLIRMSIMWTAASFCLYLLQYMNKYLSGTIFINYYLDGVAGVLAVIFGQILFNWLKTKWSYVFSYTTTLLGSIGIFIFEAGFISPYFIDSMGCPPSDYPEGSEKDREYHLKRIIPYFTFLAKIGVNLTMQFTYYVSFNDPKTFPLVKRTTAIGICNFIARFVTIFSPLIAEIDRPIPILIVIIVTTIGLITSFTFPSIEDDRQEAQSIQDSISKQN